MSLRLGIRGIARVHLPESYSLPSITGQPCIAHICARAIESLRFRPAPPRARAVNCASTTFLSSSLWLARKKRISFLREICRVKFIRSKIRTGSFVKREIDRKGGGAISSPPVDRHPSATNHHKARYKCSALVLLGYLSNISSSITFSNFFESSSPFPFRYFIIHTVDRSRGKTW